MMWQVWVLLVKELRDAIRDKRSIMAAMSYALAMPIIMGLSFTKMISDMQEETVTRITIEGAAHAPDLVRYLGVAGVIHSDDSEGRKEITLIVPDAYPGQMNRGESAEVVIIADRSDQDIQTAFSHLRSSIKSYAQEMASYRLIARGISPEVANPVAITVHDQATRASRSGIFLGGILLILVMSVFISGLNLAIDTSAGERERNSLGLLLCQPVSTGQILTAKTLAVSCFALLGLMLTLVVSMVVFPRVPWEELGFSVHLEVSTALAIVLITVPVAFLASTLQLFFSFFAKSFKEAQSYMTIIILVPAGLALVSSFDLFPGILKWLPVSGQQLVLMEIIKGESVPVVELTVTTLVTLLIAFALGLAASYSLKREKVIFGI